MGASSSAYKFRNLYPDNSINMTEETILIPGPAGDLECRVSLPSEWENNKPIAIVCHPHPLYGGTLTNKVVHMLAKTCMEFGCLGVRFNFRGVGKSQGEFANGSGEREDLLTVVSWVKQQYKDSPLWLAGFSFGAYVALMAHEAIRPERLLVVAPAVDMYPVLNNVQVVTPDWVLAQGGDDEIISAEAVRAWQAQQSNAPKLLWFDDTGHFFHGKLTQLNERIKSVWSE